MFFCPSDETLARLGRDTLDVVERTAIEEHVQHCEKCVGMLEKFVLHDTAIGPESASLPAEENLPRIPGFAIEGEVGRGGMGVVYRAWDAKLARTVALKVVRSGPMTGWRERKRWLSEARCGTRVNHPNVVQVHGADEADGWLYLVLGFVPGGSLKDRLGGPLPARAAAELMVPVTAAVTAIHAAGLLHLDLKPSNILLDSPIDAAWKDARPKVADFGIARPLADLNASATSTAGPWGTPSYMAPEQIVADRAVVGPATDVYALGAILYELLTGRPPFQGASTLETLDQVRRQQPVPPRRLNPKLPRDLETIALKCLEKNPSRRYASADTLADDLHRWLDGRPIAARPVSPIEHSWRWCGRQPVTAGLAAALVLSLFGGLLGLLALLWRSESLRMRSEANYLVASRSLDYVLTICKHLTSDQTFEFNSRSYKDELLHAMESARSQEIDLSKRYPLDMRGLRQVAMFDDSLATLCLRNGKKVEARSLTEEAIQFLDACLALAPDDQGVYRELFGQMCRMLTLIDSNNNQLYEQWNARSIAILERFKSARDYHVRATALLSRNHRLHVDELMLHGETNLARKELEQDLSLLRSLPAEEAAFPEIVLNETNTLCALGQWSSERADSRSSFHSGPGVLPVKEMEEGLGELTARQAGWLPSILNSSWLIPKDLPAEAWADRVLSAIQSGATKFELDRNRIPAILWLMREHAKNTTSRYRRDGRLDDAHRVFDQLLALANRLTQSYPDQAASFMLLSEGYVQRAKNAYQVPGEPAIEWEQKALEAAKHAASLDPENGESLSLVNDRRFRVKKLASK